ncbi:MAG TPA: hypothetical protein VHM88_05455 [Candidatus Acidoferrales bacterium]|nr:hypothetical protein [Candidatus Acidoferrales bacterium]
MPERPTADKLTRSSHRHGDRLDALYERPSAAKRGQAPGRSQGRAEPRSDQLRIELDLASPAALNRTETARWPQ